MNSRLPEPDPNADDALLDDIFARAVDAQAIGEAVNLDELLAGHEHLRNQAERLLAMARDLGSVRAPDVSRREPQIGGYTLLGEVGRGGMGIVYRARQESLGRDVALKVLSPALLASKRARRRFALEARALARVRHPHVVAVHEILADERLCAYAMEWIEGVSLAEAIAARDPRLDVRGVARLGEQVARALRAVHAASLVHRDVKPSNVLLRSDGSPVLTDFGLVHDDETSMHTRTGEFLGTTAFAAPEQLRGEHALVGAWTDVYSLGVTLYAALAGDTPFGSTTTAGMLRRIEEGAGVPLTKRNTKVPRDLATVLAKAMDRDPQRRYATASDFADDLARFLAFEPVSAQPAGFTLRAQRWLERSPQLALALAALLLTLSVGMSVAIWLAIDLAAQREALSARQREFDQVSGVVLYERAIADEQSLHPPWPQRIASLERWLRDDAGRLLAMRPGIERTLRELAARDGGAASSLTDSERFLRDTLSQLDTKLERLANGQRASVERRLAWARRVEQLTRAHPRARVSWQEARAAIAAADDVRASVAYRGQAIALGDTDVLGLVPIGMNPATKLWEFYDLRSAWDGVRDPDTLLIPTHVAGTGHIAVGDETGVVFVLAPGGRFVLGAQGNDPAAPNYDPQAAQNEQPHEVTLAPFFIARHELTQGQWRRLTDGDMPSHFKAGNHDAFGAITLAHPVEQVDWSTASTLLTQHGMTLPTEAQWECAARAGTDTPWWCGRERESLRGVANLGDQAARRAGANWSEIADWPEFDDGFAAHAPVDTLRANPYGLHHVHGNVFEWCADRIGSYHLPWRAGDGLREVPAEVTARVPRGGSLTNAARGLRVAFRRDYTPTLRYLGLGVRPARALHQP